MRHADIIPLSCRTLRLLGRLYPRHAIPRAVILSDKEWHESAHQDIRPEHMCDRNCSTKTDLNLGGNATISTTHAQVC